MQRTHSRHLCEQTRQTCRENGRHAKGATNVEILTVAIRRQGPLCGGSLLYCCADGLLLQCAPSHLRRHTIRCQGRSSIALAASVSVSRASVAFRSTHRPWRFSMSAWPAKLSFDSLPLLAEQSIRAHRVQRDQQTGLEQPLRRNRRPGPVTAYSSSTSRLSDLSTASA